MQKSTIKLKWVSSNRAESTGLTMRQTAPTVNDPSVLCYTSQSSGGYNKYRNGSGTTQQWTGCALPNCTSYSYGRACEFLDTTVVDLHWTEETPGVSEAMYWFGNNKDKYDANLGGYPYLTTEQALTMFARGGKVVNRKDNPFTFAGCIACKSDGNHVYFVEKEIIVKNENGDDTWQWITSESGAGSSPYFWKTDTVDPRIDVFNSSGNGVIILPRNIVRFLKKFPWVLYKNIIY